jgi:hypothetical protein
MWSIPRWFVLTESFDRPTDLRGCGPHTVKFGGVASGRRHGTIHIGHDSDAKTISLAGAMFTLSASSSVIYITCVRSR